MDNPLLAGHELPPFPEIRPEHVEPAIRAIPGAGRHQLEMLATAHTPGFDTLVEPLEAQQHRL